MTGHRQGPLKKGPTMKVSVKPAMPETDIPDNTMYGPFLIECNGIKAISDESINNVIDKLSNGLCHFRSDYVQSDSKGNKFYLLVVTACNPFHTVYKITAVSRLSS
jgi:hypothetical protein